MKNNENNASIIETIVLFFAVLNAIILKVAYVENERWYLALFITLPLLVIAFLNNRQKSRSNAWPQKF